MSSRFDGSGGGGTSRGLRLLRKSSNLIKEMGWQGLGKSAIGTLLLTVVVGGADLLNAMFNVPITVLGALTGVFAELNIAVFGSIADFIESVIGSAGASFGTGWTALLGPFQGPLGVGIGLIMLWEVAWYLDYTDRDVIGFALDLPDILFNSDDSGVADEDE